MAETDYRLEISHWTDGYAVQVRNSTGAIVYGTGKHPTEAAASADGQLWIDQQVPAALAMHWRNECGPDCAYCAEDDADTIELHLELGGEG